jgi:hypothetical protein
MKITADKPSTNLVKKYLSRKGIVEIKDTWHGFGEVSIRIVSVGETDKYDWSASKYERVLNIEVTAKKTGYHFSEDKIPSKYAWGYNTQMSFYKKRKSRVEFNFNRLILNTDIPMFLKFAGIPQTRFGNQFLGNVKFKYID